MTNQQVVVQRQPEGVPVPEDFTVVNIADPDGAGVLCDVLYLSLDPYLRGQLSGRHMSGSIQAGEPMVSETILRVKENGDGYQAGDLVRGFAPWQNTVRLPAAQLTAIPNTIEPASLFLGVLGMPGLTAYAGVHRILKPQAGNTLFVSAAAGPVGATVAQLCKLAGATTVGIAGSDEKCAWLTEAANFDIAINYKQQDLREALAQHCPNGIDMYFDNVGGDVLQAAMEHLAVGARVALCGLMEQYNTDNPPPGPNPALTIKARATVGGLVVYDHEDLRGEMVDKLTALISSKQLAYKEDITVGLENAPTAFCRLMAGKNFGKTIVKLNSE